MALPNGAARGADVLTELPQPTGGAHPKTVAIVVTYNRRDVVRRTLASIETQTLPPDATYVVDNGSSDGTAEMMQREFPQVRVIQLRDNPGPAAGFAAAMRTILEESDEASVDFFWTMDDDSCPAPDALETLLGAAAELQHVEVGVLAWKGGRIRRGAIQQLPNAKLDPLPNSNFGYRVRAADFSHVDGSLIARRAVERAGLPRADLFIMFEDYEYTMRIRETGLTVAVLEEDLMTRGHLGAGTRDGSSAPWRGYYQTRNHLRVALDRRSGWLLLGWAIRQVKLSVATVLFQDRKWERLRFRALGLWHALRGRLGRTIEPDAARPRLPGDRVRSTTRRGSVVSHRSPRVAIGLPVRNGERYLSEAIDSLLAQSFTDFELIVGDNASTDATESICRAAAARDRRLRYVRHDRNLGAAPNYNAVFELSSSEYFRWAAHDDVWHPDHLALSVEALDDDPRAVLSFSGAVDIDAEGRRLGRWQFPAELGSADASVRFRAIAYQEETLPIFGLIRTDVMAQTHLHEHYTNCDRVLLAELALHGPFRQVGGDLFLHREHAGRARYAARSRQERLRWYDTSRSSAVYFPEWLWLHGYTRAIRRAPIDSQTRIRCLGALAPHLRNRARFLALDAAGGARRMIRTLKPAGPGTA